MSVVVGNKSFAFITAYLMGVSHKVLYRDFGDDYANSNGLELLKRVENAELLRTLTKMRQFILLHYKDIVSFNTFQDLEHSDVGNFLHILRQYGITFSDSDFTVLDITSVVNKLSELIDSLVLGVLGSFGFPHIDKVSRYFSIGELSNDELADLVTYFTSNSSRFPHWIYVHDQGRTAGHLSRIFNDDKRLFVTAYSLSQGFYDYSNIDIPQFDWGKLGVPDSFAELSVTNQSIFYVDCDNITFEVFLSLLDRLKSISLDHSRHIFKLFLDEASDSAWSVVSDIVDPSFNLDISKVDRIKGNKSVVDMVMAASITKDFATTSGFEQIVLSSDSDFFGLMQSGIPLTIYYDRVKANRDYINLLSKQGVTTFDLCTLDTESSRQRYKMEVLTALCLHRLSTIPLQQWTLEGLVKVISTDLTNGFWYGTQYTCEEYTETAKQVLGDINISKGVKLSALGVEVAV